MALGRVKGGISATRSAEENSDCFWLRVLWQTWNAREEKQAAGWEELSFEVAKGHSGRKKVRRKRSRRNVTSILERPAAEKRAAEGE